MPRRAETRGAESWTVRSRRRVEACEAPGIERLAQRALTAVVETHGKAVAVGMDVVSVDTVASWLARYDDDTLRMIFTDAEIQGCRSDTSPQRRFAICFAAKEAIGKALGLGLAGIMWNEIETQPDEAALQISLRGSASEAARRRGITGWSASCARLRKEVAVVVLGQSGGLA
jgi:holo-[acyl-carrier protein] synthase